jgi:hypothetical protein
VQKVEVVNQWNGDWRYVKSCLTDNNDILLELDRVPIEPKVVADPISGPWMRGLIRFISIP